MECHLGIHISFRGENLGLNPVGCEREEEICDFALEEREIKDQKSRRKLGGEESKIEK